MTTETTTVIPVRWWKGNTEDDLQPTMAELGVETDDRPNEITIHTFVNGRGSLSSLELDRESARRLALRLLLAAEPD